MAKKEGKKQTEAPDIEKIVSDLIEEYNRHYENAAKEMETILKKASESGTGEKYLEPTLSLLRSFFIEGVQVGEQVLDAITDLHLKQIQLNREFAERLRELVASYWGSQNEQLQKHLSTVLNEWLEASSRLLADALALSVRTYINSLNFAFCLPRLAQPILEIQVKVMSEYFSSLSSAWEQLRKKFIGQEG